jgi:putative ABC transport system permease protein
MHARESAMSVRRFFRRARWDDERRRELDAHFAIEVEDNIARGMTARDARDAAHRKLGNPTLIREEIYDMNSLILLEHLWQDVRYGVRLLARNPGFAAVAILSLALGIGANTAIFQLLDAVRLRTLPVASPQDLAEVRIVKVPGGRTGNFMGRQPNLTNPLWEHIRDQQQAFSGMLAWGTATFNLSKGGEARYAEGLWVSGGFFDTLGVHAVVGRTLTPDDDRRGCASPGVVISYAFWQREFGGNPAVVGRSLTLDGHPFDIIGVTPASFFGVDVGRSFDVAVPLCSEPTIRERITLDARDVWYLAAIGRLKPGWTEAQATAQLAAISPGIFEDTLPPAYSTKDATHYLSFRLEAHGASTGVSNLRRAYSTPLYLLLAISGLVLLIACANLANLMLARATARERELAVRLAIGASRPRIVRQLLAESLVIAAIGAGAGAILAQWLSRFLVAFLSSDSRRLFLTLQLDWRIFAFTTALAVATALLFGLAPALRATRTSPGAAMKAGSRGSTDSHERFGLRRALVVVQVALSLVLVVGALLFVRTLRNLMTLDPGFRQEGIVVANFDMRRTGIAEARRIPSYDEITQTLRGLPRVESAAMATIVPVSGSGWNETVVIGGTVQTEFPNFNRVSPGYFRMMGTPLLAGRDFDGHDTITAPPVALVNQSFAGKFFGGRNPIGHTFQVEAPAGEPRPLYQIVGLVKDTKYIDMREPFAPIVFLAAAQDPHPDVYFTVLLRSAAPLTLVTSEVTQAAIRINPSIVLQFDTMTSQVHQTLVSERLMATLSGFFGVLAVLLATIGLYGVMSYMVARRRNEIGIRMALGADRAEVVGLIMREAAALLGTGIIVGAVAALAATRVASTLLFGLQPRDPATLVAAAAVLGVVAALASYLPALRASRLEPTIALREE